MKDTIEGWLDDKIGKSGRKALEQVAHALLAGIPAFLTVNWLPLPIGASVGLAVALALLLGGVREYLQNVGDEPDDETLFTLGKLPVNGDMLLDMAAYGIGGVVAGLLGFAI